MSSSIKFYYDFKSPYSYLALTQLPGLAARTGATVDYRPINVITLMGKVGNRPTSVECAAKGRYAFTDLGRWAQRLQVPITPNPAFRGIAADPLLLGAVAAQQAGQIEAYNLAVARGVWANGSTFGNDAVLTDVLTSGGVSDADRILAARNDVHAVLDAYGEEAVADGIFGVPSFVYNGQLYFGNDRMMFLEEALTG